MGNRRVNIELDLEWERESNPASALPSVNAALRHELPPLNALRAKRDLKSTNKPACKKTSDGDGGCCDVRRSTVTIISKFCSRYLSAYGFHANSEC